MIANYIFLVVGILIWIEFLVGIIYCVGKNASYVTAFISRPFGIPMPSMILGIVARVLLIATGTFGIAKFFIL